PSTGRTRRRRRGPGCPCSAPECRWWRALRAPPRPRRGSRGAARRGVRRGRPRLPRHRASSWESNSELLAAHFPRTTRGDPEREEDEAYVEPHRLAAHVEEVVFELVPARDVARRVDLRDAG